jgi:hypothetical protein
VGAAVPPGTAGRAPGDMRSQLGAGVGMPCPPATRPLVKLRRPVRRSGTGFGVAVSFGDLLGQVLEGLHHLRGTSVMGDGSGP